MLRWWLQDQVQLEVEMKAVIPRCRDSDLTTAEKPKMVMITQSVV